MRSPAAEQRHSERRRSLHANRQCAGCRLRADPGGHGRAARDQQVGGVADDPVGIRARERRTRTTTMNEPHQPRAPHRPELDGVLRAVPTRGSLPRAVGTQSSPPVCRGHRLVPPGPHGPLLWNGRRACHHCGVLREGGRDWDDRWSYAAAGLAACAALAVVDWTSTSLVLIPLLVLAPLIACSGGHAARHARSSRSWPSAALRPAGVGRRHRRVATPLGGRSATTRARWSGRGVDRRHARGTRPEVGRVRADHAPSGSSEGGARDRPDGGVVVGQRDRHGHVGRQRRDAVRSRGRASSAERSRIGSLTSTSGTGRWCKQAVAAGVAGREPFRFDHRCVVARRERSLDRGNRRRDRRSSTATR